MIAFRYRLRATPMRIAEKSFTADGVDFPAGSFVIIGAPAAEWRAAVEQLGLTAAALSAAAGVCRCTTRPRRASPSTRSGSARRTSAGTASRSTEFGIPYDLIYKEQVARRRPAREIRRDPDGRAEHQPAGVLQAPAARPQPYQKTDKYKFLGMYGETPDMSGGFGQVGVDAFAKFLEGGGTLIAAAAAARFPIEFGWAHTVDAESDHGVTAQRPIVQAEIAQPEHPAFYGYTGT